MLLIKNVRIDKKSLKIPTDALFEWAVDVIATSYLYALEFYVACSLSRLLG